MTVSYQTNIISAIRKILIDDDTEPTEGHCIDYFVPDEKVVHGGNPDTITPPFISLWFEVGESFSGLPAEKADFVINIWYNKRTLLARTKLEQCSSRIVNLLDKKPLVVNAQGFTTKVKSIRKIKAIPIPEDDDGLFHQLLIFAVIFSNE